MAVGAAGCPLKQPSADLLPEAIREGQAVFFGWVSSDAEARGQAKFRLNGCSRNEFGDEIGHARRLHSHYGQSPHQGELAKKGARLSSREVAVRQLIAEEQAVKQVAAELGISIKTVEKHRQRLRQKLNIDNNIHDTAGLTRYAIAAGLIESSVPLTIV